jgi:hypothetical protein
MANGLEWPVEGASFYNRRTKTVLRVRWSRQCFDSVTELQVVNSDPSRGQCTDV